MSCDPTTQIVEYAGETERQIILLLRQLTCRGMCDCRDYIRRNNGDLVAAYNDLRQPVDSRTCGAGRRCAEAVKAADAMVRQYQKLMAPSKLVLHQEEARQFIKGVQEHGKPAGIKNFTVDWSRGLHWGINPITRRYELLPDDETYTKVVVEFEQEDPQ